MGREYRVQPHLGIVRPPATVWHTIGGRAINARTSAGRGVPMTPFERAEFADMESRGETRRVSTTRILTIHDKPGD